ncbi:solute carrier family 46 member 3 [Cricetulus griseus]|nr:solute carrier family 46 member 3 [Cricetulus griseus]
MSGLIPGLVSTFMLLSSSDNHGRKLPMVLSSLGSLGTNIWLCVLSYFGFPLQFLIASTFIGALFGNYTTFWGACFAYIVDQCKDYKQKIIRIAVLDFMLGVVTGLTGLSSGYFIRELGFVWSYFIIAIVLTVNLTYISFFLSDPIKESSSQIVTVSCSENLKDLFYRTYLLFKNGSGIWLFSYCLEDIHIVFIGILTTVVGMTLTAFTKTTLMMLLGALFACIAFLETLSGVTATSVYNGIYSATVAWYPGFIFLLSAGLLVLPAISLWGVKCIGWEEGSYTLFVPEEPSEHTSE